ncbi:hypothetical protein Avbf_18546, partial [Armadillidium vulgare]
FSANKRKNLFSIIKLKERKEKKEKKEASQERLQKEKKLNEFEGLESSATNKDCHKVKVPKKMRLQASKSLTTKNGISQLKLAKGCIPHINYLSPKLIVSHEVSYW